MGSSIEGLTYRLWPPASSRKRQIDFSRSAGECREPRAFSLWNKLFYDIFRATFSASLTGWSTFIFSPTSQESIFFFKLKSPSESWQLLVEISISAAVEADYMGVVPHTGSDINLPRREETIMMLLIDAFICMQVYKLDSSSCLSTACNMCIFVLIYDTRLTFLKKRIQ